MDYIKYCARGQVATLDEAEERLNGERFPWIQKKVKTVKLADLYEQAGYPEYAERARTCATWLQYGEFPNGERKLTAANFCQLRLCPMCMARRAKKSAYKLSRILDKVEQEHNCKYIFLTLAMRNVPGDQLSDAYDQLLSGWKKLIRHRQFQRSIKGTARFMETTRGDNRWHRRHGKRVFVEDNGYHPHLHVIMAVPPEYFNYRSGLYITHDKWVEMWKLALGVDYRPTAHIEAARKKGEAVAELAAAKEACKYPVKDKEYIDVTLPDERLVEILSDYTEALKGRRLTSFGGWLKEAARALDADDLDSDSDLVHVDEDRIRSDVADLIAVYNWNFGVGDYILTNRELNPLKVVFPKPDGADQRQPPKPIEHPEDDLFPFWLYDEETPWDKT